MWTIVCGSCKVTIGYSLVKPEAYTLVFYEETLHKDFTPVKHTKDFLACDGCGGSFPGMLCFAEDSKKVFDFKRF